MNEQVGLVRTKVEIDGNLEINLPINNYKDVNVYKGPRCAPIRPQGYRCIQITLYSDNAAYSVDNSQEYKWQN